jgi:hypothetical protein
LTESEQNHYALVVKKDCATCCMIEDVIHDLIAAYGDSLSVYVQDDPEFPASVSERIDDTSLEFSYRNDIEVVPTLIRFNNGNESERIFGWDKAQWQQFTTIENLGTQLTDFRPGCGSKTQDPGMAEKLTLKYDSNESGARKLDIDEAEDIMEACFDRGWTDGLPVVPPTALRVHRMLQATPRKPDEIIGNIPPDYVPCTIEKVAINAVMAGCKPEYFPTVLATVEAALQDKFCMHGLLCTTYFSSPVVIVNGPTSRKIGMNSGVNALGQGNRANATIGRALQLLIFNVGGGKPGGIDRATMGHPGKYTYCFTENEDDASWPSLAMDRGFQREDSVVSLFAGAGLQPFMDQQSRTPEPLAKSFAASLRTVSHPKIFLQTDVVLVLSPEHKRVFQLGGWDKAQVAEAIISNLNVSGDELIRGAGGITEGMPEQFKGKTINKFRTDGFHIATAGGGAGLFSAIIAGWVASGERGSQLVSQKY